MGENAYKKLIAWQKADALAYLIYEVSLTFPKDELFGLTSQLKRAVFSIVLNIVDGYARDNKKEFHRFLAISLGSFAETGYLIDFAYKRKFMKKSEYEDIRVLYDEVGRLIWKLYKSMS